ncbi:phenylacetaldehyde reductase [Aristolochia californica]|uniref:phenylacetaldehyde reductase n=1 Tax=Aristolochia californica TaxID=171875 RepID=UPI0035E20407
MTQVTGERRVCVTGANGFIGSWLVRALLAKGYTVHGTHAPGTPTSHLRSLPGADSRLLLSEADLLDSNAFRAPIKGCSGVFHVASPCTLATPQNPDLELIQPALQGTLNVLQAAAASAATIRRVVITASISSLIPNPSWAARNEPVDESSWTDIDYCKAHQEWYPLSKTLAEKAAWDFAGKHGLDMVTIHPSTCIGPLLQPGLNASSAVLLQLLQGSQDTQGDHYLGCVHVQDVADAHVLAFETPMASGRYLCTNGIYQFKHFAEKVAELCPQFPVHRFSEDTQPGLVACRDAAKRLISLGLAFRPIEEAVRDAVECFKANGFLEGQLQKQN